MTWDVIRRYLTYVGYKVTLVQNFTDVDDKIINKANAEGSDWKTISDRYIDAYFKVIDALHVRRADVYPRVSEHMDDIIHMVEKLIENGHAYQLDAYHDWEGLESFFKKLGNREDIWYASNIEICQYILAVRSLVYSSTGDYIFNPTCTDVWLMIDGRPYQIPSGKTVSIPWKHTND